MTKAAYSKVALTYQQQLSQLKKRGLQIPDEKYFLHLLEVKSYYRLSGYWYPLLDDKKNHQFKKGASFDTAYKIYCFDRALRHFVLVELEKIEVAIRAKMIYILSHKYGPFWYLDSELFKDINRHNQLVDKLEQEFIRSDEEFILAFRSKYSDPMPPSWMMMEVTSFGTLSVIYSNLNPVPERREIAGAFGLPDKVFSSWLHSIVYLRNICAHHSRLWNRVMSIQPLIPRNPHFEWINGSSVKNDTTYYFLSMLVYLMNRIKTENDVVDRFKQLLSEYPNIYPPAMGFPPEWKTESLWK